MNGVASGILLTEDRGAVRILKLNRPEVHNALNDELRAILAAAIRATEADPSVRAIVLTGEGPKAFSAGADVNVLLRRTPRAMLDQFREERIDFVLERCTKPVIAAINGYALGGGVRDSPCVRDSDRLGKRDRRFARGKPGDFPCPRGDAAASAACWGGPGHGDDPVGPDSHGAGSTGIRDCFASRTARESSRRGYCAGR